MPEYSINDLGFDDFLDRSGLSDVEQFDSNMQSTFDESGSSIDVSGGILGGYSGGLADLTDGLTAPQTIQSGGMSAALTQTIGSVLKFGKTKFDNTENGYILGVDTDNLGKLYIGNTTAYLNWTGSALNIAGAISASTIDIGGADATSFHVDIDGNMWLGAATFAASNAKISNAGDGTFNSITITGGSISSTPISGIPNNTSTDISLLSHSYSMVFSVTDVDTIAWGAGSIVLSNGRTFAIDAGNTGNMAALTYIYLDTAVSSTVLQTTTTYSTAMGANKLLIGTAQNNTVTASFIPFGGSQPLIDGTAQIGALSITAASIAASTITAGKLSVSQLSAISADMGAITAGTITVVGGGNTVSFTPASATVITSGPTGSPTFTVTAAGALTSTSGSIGAFTIGATTISATNLTLTSGAANTANIVVGTGATAGGLNSANAAGDIVFWAGSTFANRAIAPFRVEADGDVIMTSATITGSTLGNYQAFTADGTWTKPTGAQLVVVVIIGGGGGGGGGQSAGSFGGGTGGGGGAYIQRVFRAADLSATVTVTVGSGGGAGAANADGSVGGNSSFGSYLVAYGGGGGYRGTGAANSGGGGGGHAGVGQAGQVGANSLGGSPAVTAGANGLSGQGAGGTGAAAGSNAEYGGGAGGGNTTPGVAGGSSIFGCPGGGGGATTPGPGGSTGGAGGNIRSYSAGGGGAGGAGGAGANDNGSPGTAGTDGDIGTGGGGGGSGGVTSGTGGAGGAGGVPGGGGGGGGGGNTGAAGAAGARGEVRIYTI